MPCRDSSGTVIADFSREENGKHLLEGKWCRGDSFLFLAFGVVMVMMIM